jgi:hypothetical protein
MRLRRRRVKEKRELRLRMGDAFPADSPLARWVMSLSIALGDMRIAMDYAVRDEQPFHERAYFVRLMDAHMRETVKVVVLGHEREAEVRAFVASMPKDGQEAFEEIKERLAQPFELRPDVTLLDELKRLRDDYFHYPLDAASQERLSEAMRVVENERGVYALEDDKLRATYADLVTANVVHPFGDATGEEVDALSQEMHGRMVELVGPISTLIQGVEAHYLFGHLPEGTVEVVDCLAEAERQDNAGLG